MTIDPDKIWDIIQWQEPVTVTGYDPASDAPAPVATGVNAYWADAAAYEKPVGDGGKTYTATRVWCLRAARLGAVSVSRRSRITQAGGAVWRVDAFKVIAQGGTIRCVCYQEDT